MTGYLQCNSPAKYYQYQVVGQVAILYLTLVNSIHSLKVVLFEDYRSASRHGDICELSPSIMSLQSHSVGVESLVIDNNITNRDLVMTIISQETNIIHVVGDC